MAKSTKYQLEFLAKVRNTIRREFTNRKEKSPILFSSIITFLSGVAGVLLTYIITPSVSEKISAELNTRSKIAAQQSLVSLLKEGRIIKGRDAAVDYLPAQVSLEHYKNWWQKITDFYGENDQYFDKTIDDKLTRLNELVFQQQDLYALDSGIQMRHDLKKDLIGSCNSIVEYLKSLPLK